MHEFVLEVHYQGKDSNLDLKFHFIAQLLGNLLLFFSLTHIKCKSNYCYSYKITLSDILFLASLNKKLETLVNFVIIIIYYCKLAYATPSEIALS